MVHFTDKNELYNFISVNTYRRISYTLLREWVWIEVDVWRINNTWFLKKSFDLIYYHYRSDFDLLSGVGDDAHCNLIRITSGLTDSCQVVEIHIKLNDSEK